MPTNVRTRPHQRGTELVPCAELVRLLNDDFAGEHRSIFAHAVYAERLRAVGEPGLSKRVARLAAAKLTAPQLAAVLARHSGE